MALLGSLASSSASLERGGVTNKFYAEHTSFFFTFLNIDEIVMASVNLSCIGYFDQPNTGFTAHLYTGKSMKNTSSTEADVQ